MKKFYYKLKLDTDYAVIMKVSEKQTITDIDVILNQIPFKNRTFLKASYSSRIIDIQELYDFKYSHYLILNNEIYNEDSINKLIEIANAVKIKFIHRIPPTEILELIEVKK